SDLIVGLFAIDEMFVLILQFSQPQGVTGKEILHRLLIGKKQRVRADSINFATNQFAGLIETMLGLHQTQCPLALAPLPIKAPNNDGQQHAERSAYDGLSLQQGRGARYFAFDQRSNRVNGNQSQLFPRLYVIALMATRAGPWLAFLHWDSRKQHDQADAWERDMLFCHPDSDQCSDVISYRQSM
ncbi:hypothetical protein ACFL2H_11610, partial [Planctomycetota bacterium]